jgi:hypothetical protein
MTPVSSCARSKAWQPNGPNDCLPKPNEVKNKQTKAEYRARLNTAMIRITMFDWARRHLLNLDVSLPQ